MFIVSFQSKLLFLNRSDFRTDQYLLNSPSHFNSLKLLNKGKVNKKNVRKFDVRSHVTQELPCGFKEYSNNTNSDNSNSNNNNNNNNNDNKYINNNNVNTGSKHNNINNDNIHSCNS